MKIHTFFIPRVDLINMVVPNGALHFITTVIAKRKQCEKNKNLRKKNQKNIRCITYLASSIRKSINLEGLPAITFSIGEQISTILPMTSSKIVCQHSIQINVSCRNYQYRNQIPLLTNEFFFINLVSSFQIFKAFETKHMPRKIYILVLFDNRRVVKFHHKFVVTCLISIEISDHKKIFKTINFSFHELVLKFNHMLAWYVSM